MNAVLISVIVAWAVAQLRITTARELLQAMHDRYAGGHLRKSVLAIGGSPAHVVRALASRKKLTPA